ncbi:AMP-binding protein [Gordonia humi]|uniref:Fatty-acyl-CoA synthase n=1 Tax=Gordonia humi TaxID=686429 RepID=A0A840EQR8_9ACTN|nr:AMP-binding protein [Gordonia humi]MBB4134052.1 fatty-acyl-CoA synthase [Gordonia humi]
MPTSELAGEFAFAELTPTAFLSRAARVFAGRIAVVDGDRQFTYAEFADRVERLRGGLARSGVRPGDRVAVLCSNSHLMLELHTAVPAAGAVLVPLNTRQSVAELAYIVEHSGATLMIATAELAVTAGEVAADVGIESIVEGPAYENLIGEDVPVAPSIDERGLLAINYTSGTTGRPKGVMYHHRGAYLQALAMAYHARLEPGSRYLWTLPMFHCCGWSFTWAVAAAGGTNVCLRAIDPLEIWHLLHTEGITHFSAAPTVLTMLAESSAATGLSKRVSVQTGGAPPSPTLLERMAGLGFDVEHLYGMTETFGPVIVNQWQPDWNALDPVEIAKLKARQGIGNISATAARVVDASGNDIPGDASTIGELVVRGNNVMLGYYRDRAATVASTTVDGWLRTGDLAVMHPDGYVEIADRAKDVIISGGENIASVEVERVLDSHPDVVQSALIGRPDEKWGEVPVAYVELRADAQPDVDGLRAHVRKVLAGYKVPREVVFTDLPKTATGKIRKDRLRASSDGG